jgi:hypothetical protein
MISSQEKEIQNLVIIRMIFGRRRRYGYLNSNYLHYVHNNFDINL